MLKLLRLPEKLSPVTKKNFMLNLFDGAVFSFAMGFVSMTTVLPVYVKQIGGSNIEVGMIQVIWTLGFNLPQIFIANYTSNQPFKKMIMIKTALAQRLPWLLLAIISFIIASGMVRETGLLLFFLVYALAAIGGGINLPAWFDLFAKITPVMIRGKQFAYRMTLGAMLGVAAGWFTKYLLDNMGTQYGYTILFLTAFLITMISYLLLLQLVEEEPNYPKRNIKYKEFFVNLPVILKTKHNYRNFLIADALIISAIISNAFLAVNAVEKFNLPESYIGIFTIIMMVSMMFGSLIFGVMADHLGHRLNFILAAEFALLTSISALITTTIELYLFSFAASAVTTAILQVSRLPLISEIASEEDRPVYISLSNAITVPFVLLGIPAGWLANVAGYNAVFLITSVFAILSVIWIVLKLHEPRKLIIK
ncbi:MAG: MFS transporter [Melioribacteraceae bacterium]|nr:MFS transporter [Melioribacteraceae bacterium]